MLPNPAANPDLYGRPKAKNIISTSISSASSIALSSELAKLSSSTNSNRGRKRPTNSSKTDDLFKRGSNKGVASRAARDDAQRTTSKDIGYTEDADLRRARKNMEEKSRLYNAMKRGDYVPPTKRVRSNGWQDDDRAGSLIDFDRKWAEEEREKDTSIKTTEGKESTSSSEDEYDSDPAEPDDNELVEYTDEFGRLRKMTKKEVRKQERQELRRPPIRRDYNYNNNVEDDEDSAIPAEPRKIIIGDTIQAAAFDEDDFSRRHDELLSRKVEETHYDATAEIRTKGVGFYQFSRDAEARQKEMEALSAERDKTSKERQEREARKEARRREIETRREELKKKRQGKQAENWLMGFMEESAEKLVPKEKKDSDET